MDVHEFVKIYERLNANTLDLLVTLYHPQIVFQDPAHRIEGLQALQRYFHALFENVSECQFKIDEQYQIDDIGFISWKMVFCHPRMNRGNPIEVQGMSKIRFEASQVIFHRDYFDLGSMIYEHIPVIGYAIKKLKQRLSQ